MTTYLCPKCLLPMRVRLAEADEGKVRVRFQCTPCDTERFIGFSPTKIEKNVENFLIAI